MIIRDIFLTDQCEEARRCLDINCSYNKTTLETFTKSFNIEPGSIPSDFLTKNPLLGLDFTELVKQYPRGGILIKKKESND